VNGVASDASRRSVSVKQSAALLGIAFAMLLPVTLLVRPAPAEAHWTLCDSVHNNQVRWISFTSYTAERDYAAQQWNKLGVVQFVQATGASTADLRFSDTWRPDVTWAAKYSCVLGYNYIKFNPLFMDTFPTAKRQNIALHEMGHSLKLGHSFTGQVMAPFAGLVTTPQSHDIEDYCRQWPCIYNNLAGDGGANQIQPPTSGPLRRMY
jgi:hypothetical protein